MNIILSGCGGHMGRNVIDVTEKLDDVWVVAGVDPFCKDDLGFPCYSSFDEVTEDADVIIDFSHHSLTGALTAFAESRNIPLVIATTGQTEEEKDIIFNASNNIPLFFAANYSLGVALLIDMAKKVAAAMPEAEIEIIEAHHNRKLDAPSGTALAIAEGIKEVRKEAEINMGRSGNGRRTPSEIGVSSIRMGNIVGIHEVMIGTDNQTITLKHEAHNRALFAEGAVSAARFLVNQEAGLYKMDDLTK